MQSLSLNGERVWAVAAATAILYYFFPDFLMTIPLFVLCADCGGCASSASSGGGADFGSTPFLYVWRNGKYCVENDVMFGKPQSIYPTLEIGRRVYESGGVKHDLYRIQTPLEASDGKIKLQIRELEPEESSIDHISLVRVIHPQNTEVFVDSSFERVWAFEKEALSHSSLVKNTHVKNTENGTDLTPMLLADSLESAFEETPSYEEAGAYHSMQQGDSIEITANVTDRSTPLFFFLESVARDWTAGEIIDFGNETSFTDVVRTTLGERISLARKGRKIASATLIFAVLWLGGLFGHHGANKTDESVLLQAWGPTKVLADTPHTGGCNSLVVEYWDGKTFNSLDVISPRYYRPSFSVMRVPSGALNRDGSVRIRVTATKGHHVTKVGLRATHPKEINDTQEYVVSRAHHQRENKDYAEAMRSPFSGAYMRTIPADRVDVEIDVSEAQAVNDKAERETHLLKIGGHYNPASAEVQREAAYPGKNWVEKLDLEEQQWLGKMYSLRAYPGRREHSNT